MGLQHTWTANVNESALKWGLIALPTFCTSSLQMNRRLEAVLILFCSDYQLYPALECTRGRTLRPLSSLQSFVPPCGD